MTDNRICGVSGGRTSALMALEHVPDRHRAVFTFQNTGREHSKTLDFICRVEDELQQPIVRLEWRPPPRRGDPPRNASFAILTHAELARNGEPFRELLESLAAYRATKGEAPIAPWARQRLCTAYLKIKTQNRYARSLGWEAWTSYVGFRADESHRITEMLKTTRQYIDPSFPLHDEGIDKAAVLRYWSRKPYDLGIPEHLGNCIECFMKDEADLATALMDPEGSPEFAIGIERDFAPMRRGGRPSYSQVYAEAPSRMEIRASIQRGDALYVRPASLDERRYRLIVRQELDPQKAGWSCGCAGAELLAGEEDE